MGRTVHDWQGEAVAAAPGAERDGALALCEADASGTGWWSLANARAALGGPDAARAVLDARSAAAATVAACTRMARACSCQAHSDGALAAIAKVEDLAGSFEGSTPSPSTCSSGTTASPGRCTSRPARKGSRC